MPTKAKYDFAGAAIELSEFAAKRLDSRRAFEMKMSFSVWALLAASIYRGFDHLSVLVGLLTFALYGWFMLGVFRRNAADSEFAWHYAVQAAKLLEADGVSPAPDRSSLGSSKTGFLTNWAVGPQLAITAGLILVLYTSATKHVDWWATDLSQPTGIHSP
jgi:hypothetical protein